MAKWGQQRYSLPDPNMNSKAKKLQKFRAEIQKMPQFIHNQSLKIVDREMTKAEHIKSEN